MQTTGPHPCSDRCHLAQGESQEFATQPVTVIYTFVKGYWPQPLLWEAGPREGLPQPGPCLCHGCHPSLGATFPAPLRARLASCDLERQARSCQEGLWRIPRDPFIFNSLSQQPYWDLGYAAHKTPHPCSRCRSLPLLMVKIQGNK